MGVMSLGVGKDAEITISATGSDENDAINTLDGYIEKGRIGISVCPRS